MFKIGEKVKVARKYVPSEEFIWQDSMDDYIGQICEVTDIEFNKDSGSDHFELNNDWWFPPESLEKVEDIVNHPSHYTYGKGLEVIDVIDAFECGFEQGNIIKYVLRYKHKNGIEDLEKAKWYLNHLIEKEKNK